MISNVISKKLIFSIPLTPFLPPTFLHASIPLPYPYHKLTLTMLEKEIRKVSCGGVIREIIGKIPCIYGRSFGLDTYNFMDLYPLELQIQLAI